MTDASERIWVWDDEGRDCITHPGYPYPASAIEYVRADLPNPLDDPRAKARSDAIHEFCEKAGLSDAVQVAGLPNDVRAYRRNSAVAYMKARAALSALEDNK